jgi:hypothetical protein
MRPQRRLLVVAILVLILAVSVVAWWLSHADPPIRYRTWAKIEHGMSLADVEAMIGVPPGNYGGEELDAYIAGIVLRHPAGPDQDLVIDVFKRSEDWPAPPLDQLKAKLREGRIVVWTGPKLAIAVQTDAQGRVVATCLGTIRPGDIARDQGPVWVEWLRARLGIP